ncbi:MAG: TolC family protein [Bacteroidales bacterium]|nr:TolC family protein [Bacteroidales bacterium]MBN2749290.1 TolC family protein [Bacteroidales bacterium]
MLRKVGIMLFLVLLFFGGVAQEKERMVLSLKQAQEYALENNLNRKNAELEVDKANKKVWETTAMGLPQVTGEANLQYRLDDIPLVPFGPPDPNDPDEKPTLIPLGEKTSGTYGLTATQLIFSGPYIVGLRASKAYKQLSELSLEKTDVELKSGIATAYYLVLLIAQSKAILDSSANNITTVIDHTQKMYDVGFVDDVTVDQFKLAGSTIENKRLEVAAQLNNAKNLLKYQIGLPMSVDLELTDSYDAFIGGMNQLQYENGKLELERSIDVRILENQVKLNSLDLARQKTEFLPSLAAFFTYQEQFNEPAINFNPKMMVGLSLSVPIFSSGQRLSKVQQAKISLNQSQNSLELVRYALSMDYADALNSYRTLYSMYESAKVNRELAARVYKNIMLKYTKGMASETDVIQANDKHLEAEGNFVQAAYDLLNAKLKLDKILSLL